MSGHSDEVDCPRCGNIANRYMETRPFEQIDVRCPHCGFYTFTGVGILSDSDLEDERECWESFKKLPPKEGYNQKEFDKVYGVKQDK